MAPNRQDRKKRNADPHAIAEDVTKGKFSDYLVPDTAQRKTNNFETKR